MDIENNLKKGCGKRMGNYSHSLDKLDIYPYCGEGLTDWDEGRTKIRLCEECLK